MSSSNGRRANRRSRVFDFWSKMDAAALEATSTSPPSNSGNNPLDEALTCSVCETKIHPGARFCHTCGKPASAGRGGRVRSTTLPSMDQWLHKAPSASPVRKQSPVKRAATTKALWNHGSAKKVTPSKSAARVAPKKALSTAKGAQVKAKGAKAKAKGAKAKHGPKKLPRTKSDVGKKSPSKAMPHRARAAPAARRDPSPEPKHATPSPASDLSSLEAQLVIPTLVEPQGTPTRQRRHTLMSSSGATTSPSLSSPTPSVPSLSIPVKVETKQEEVVTPGRLARIVQTPSAGQERKIHAASKSPRRTSRPPTPRFPRDSNLIDLDELADILSDANAAQSPSTPTAPPSATADALLFSAANADASAASPTPLPAQKPSALPAHVCPTRTARSPTGGPRPKSRPRSRTAHPEGPSRAEQHLSGGVRFPLVPSQVPALDVMTMIAEALLYEPDPSSDSNGSTFYRNTTKACTLAMAASRQINTMLVQGSAVEPVPMVLEPVLPTTVKVIRVTKFVMAQMPYECTPVEPMRRSLHDFAAAIRCFVCDPSESTLKEAITCIARFQHTFSAVSAVLRAQGQVERRLSVLRGTRDDWGAVVPVPDGILTSEHVHSLALPARRLLVWCQEAIDVPHVRKLDVATFVQQLAVFGDCLKVCLTLIQGHNRFELLARSGRLISHCTDLLEKVIELVPASVDGKLHREGMPLLRAYVSGVSEELLEVMSQVKEAYLVGSAARTAKNQRLDLLRRRRAEEYRRTLHQPLIPDDVETAWRVGSPLVRRNGAPPHPDAGATGPSTEAAAVRKLRPPSGVGGPVADEAVLAVPPAVVEDGDEGQGMASDTHDVLVKWTSPSAQAREANWPTKVDSLDAFVDGVDTAQDADEKDAGAAASGAVAKRSTKTLAHVQQCRGSLHPQRWKARAISLQGCRLMLHKRTTSRAVDVSKCDVIGSVAEYESAFALFPHTRHSGIKRGHRLYVRMASTEQAAEWVVGIMRAKTLNEEMVLARSTAAAAAAGESDVAGGRSIPATVAALKRGSDGADASNRPADAMRKVASRLHMKAAGSMAGGVLRALGGGGTDDSDRLPLLVTQACSFLAARRDTLPEDVWAREVPEAEVRALAARFEGASSSASAHRSAVRRTSSGVLDTMSSTSDGVPRGSAGDPLPRFSDPMSASGASSADSSPSSSTATSPRSYEVTLENDTDVYVVARALLTYFTGINPPLCVPIYKYISDATDIQDDDTFRKRDYYWAVQALSLGARTLLTYVVHFLVQLASNLDNPFPVQSLAWDWGPAILLGTLAPKSTNVHQVCASAMEFWLCEFDAVFRCVSDDVAFGALAGRQAIQHATVDFLCESLVHDIYQVLDPSLVDSLLLTHSYYVSSSELLSKFIALYIKHRKDASRGVWHVKARSRVLDVLEYWFSNPRFLLPEEVNADFIVSWREFLRPLLVSREDGNPLPLAAKEKERFASLTKILSKHASACAHQATEANSPAQLQEQLWAQSAPPPLGESVMMSLDEVTLASHISHVEHARFACIQPYEFFQKAFLDSLKSPSFTYMTQQFNHMGLWVATEIVRLQDLAERCDMLCRAIKLADELTRLRNFHSAYAVICGLNISAVSRLTRTWKKLPKRMRTKYDSLMKLFDMSRNYKAYREALVSAKPPLVPYLGLISKDLFGIEENYDTLVDNVYVNMDKMRMVQRVTHDLLEQQDSKYKVDVQRSILALVCQLPAQTEQLVYELSLECEPRAS